MIFLKDNNHVGAVNLKILYLALGKDYQRISNIDVCGTFTKETLCMHSVFIHKMRQGVEPKTKYSINILSLNHDILFDMHSFWVVPSIL